MSIRFNCDSCNQPIEIDDEWASRTVACPYCRKTITAPPESTLGDLYEVPQARALSETRYVSDGPPPFDCDRQRGPVQPSRLPVIALVLAIASVMLYVAGNVIAVPYMLETMESLGPDANFAEMAGIGNKIIQENDGVLPGWMVTFTVLITLSGFSWMAAIVCGVISVSQHGKRGPAVAALVVCGGFSLLICCGGLLGAGL